MKYKCLVCGQIIDNNEMCPYCGSDSSQIVPIESEGKTGHYRCLVCGRETENGDYCPYCGSQRLYNLDSRKVENTTSINIQNSEENHKPEVNESEKYEHVHYENKNSFFFDKPAEVKEENNVSEDENVAPQEEFSAPKIEDEEHYESEENQEYHEEDESNESKYFNMFGELLPLDSIQNPDPEKVETLYRMGVERGYKISPEEVASAFTEEEYKEESETINEEGDYNIEEAHFEDNTENVGEENVAPEQENFIHEPEEVEREAEETLDEKEEAEHLESEVEIDPEMTNHCIEENIYDDEDLEHELYASLCLLLLKSGESEEDQIARPLLNLLKEKTLANIQEKLDVGEEENKVLALLDALVAKGNETNDEKLLKYKKFLDLFRALFDK